MVSFKPLHIIFAGAFPSGPYTREDPDGALHSISENSYMDTTLFYVFKDKLFIPKTRHIKNRSKKARSIRRKRRKRRKVI